MKFKLLRRPTTANFVIIDSAFPQKMPFGFRNIEINQYLARISSAEAYGMCSMSPWGDAWFPWSYGIDVDTFNNNLSGYLEHYPENTNRVHYLNDEQRYNFKLSYSFFLAETYTLLPFYEKNKIPFVFMLYPGGTFGLHNEASDKMLRAITASTYFRKVIVSQEITRDYLIENKLCNPEDISYVYGGFSQFTKNEIKNKKHYPSEKGTFDICFVAAKYSEQGVDKGYDLFIESAKIITNKIPDARFHVVGNFDASDIPTDELGDKITFYGYKKKEFFLDFYSEMDIFLSPNRPGKLYDGNFDGFPIGIDAGYCGVAMFVSDELNMNKFFTNNQNIVIIPLDAPAIATKVYAYYNNLDKLYDLSEKCGTISQKLFSIEAQIQSRLTIFNEVYLKEYGRELL